MKIAMITLNVYDNYGNMLQKYALYRTLKKFADFVEVLWQHNTKDFYPHYLESNRCLFGNLREGAFQSVRQNKIKEFSDANINTRFDLPYLEDIGDEYDFFVIGSDQVWNPEFKVPGRFLDFAPPKKRIAYGASIAITELPENLRETYRRKILEMPHVSIREAEGCELIERLTGRRPLHVLDPVFLLTSDEWRELEKRPPWLNQKKYEHGYLLTYFLGTKPLELIQSLANKLELPMINLLDFDNFNHYTTGIEEFLYLADHATLFCTNSFHGTAISSIFNRPFIVYRAGKVPSRFSRISSLLSLFLFEDRVTNTDLKIKVADLLKMDFNRYEEILLVERKKAFKFLENALR